MMALVEVAAGAGVGVAAGAGARALPMVGPKVGEAAAVAQAGTGAAAARALGRERALVGARALSRVAAGARGRAVVVARALTRIGAGPKGKGASTKTSRCSLRLSLRPTRTGGRSGHTARGPSHAATCSAPDATKDGTRALPPVLLSQQTGSAHGAMSLWPKRIGPF